MCGEVARPVAIFDFDGTIVDSKSGILNSLRKVLVGRGLEWQEPLEWFVGPPAHISMPQLLPSVSTADHKEIVEEYRALYGEAGWSDSALYPGVRDMLQGLRNAGWRMFICTAKRRDFTTRMLAHFGVDQHFEAVYADSADLPSHSKSELLEELLQDNRIDERAVMIGDRVFDVDAGRSCGLHTIAVTYGYGTVAELESCDPDELCGSPEDVLRTLLARELLNR